MREAKIPALIVLAALALLILGLTGVARQGYDLDRKCHEAGGQVYTMPQGGSAVCIDNDGRVIRL